MTPIVGAVTNKTNMKKLEIFAYTAAGVTPKRLQLDAEATVEDLLNAVKSNGELGDELVFLENEEEPLDRKSKLADCGIKEKSFIHCHRCRQVLVTVNYNGTQQKKFAPSATVARVLRWAIKEFNLKGQDAEDKVLRTSANGQPLDPDTHIGSLTQPGVCSLNLYLTPLVLVEG